MGLTLNQLCIWVMMLLLLHRKWGCYGGGIPNCWEDERIALLKLKDYLNYPNGNAMSSWEKIPNCCFWDYVECDSITGRVTSLYPWRDWGMEDWYINTSFFLPFKELNDLSLEEINILGCVENEGFERLSSLSNLEFLSLDGNQFNNSILPSLSGLSSLKSLSINNNRFQGTVIQELNNLTKLKELALQGNEIEGFQFSHGLTNLEVLDLSNNHLKNNKLSSLKGLQSLKSLNLAYNALKGTLDMKDLGALSNLEELDLSGNEIVKFQALRDTRGLSKLGKLILDNITTNERDSSLLQSLGAFPYLKTLSLRNNDFKGKIFVEESHNFAILEELFLDSSSLNETSLLSLGALPSLKFLSLCSLTNTLPVQGLPNFKNLEYLHLNSSATDKNVLQIIGKLTSLKTLSLSGCGLSGSIPLAEGICKLKHLQLLDMSFNDLNGTLPWCLANLTSLRLLDLSFNYFTGKILPLGGLTSLQELRLSKNHFQIPISLSPFFNNTELKYLDGKDNEVYSELVVHNSIPKFQLETLLLSGLGYAGAFPKFLYYQHNLQTVDLSHIKLEGGFPFWLLENNTKLEILYLANNSLSGPIQLPIHSHMKELDISSNGFHGHVPMGIGAFLPMLQTLKMSRNDFSGSIPDSFGNVSFLQILQLDGNQFTGNIPDSLSKCSLLDLLDISDNHLSGMIPGWMGNMSFLRGLDLSKNNISGTLTSNFNPPQLVHIYLSGNRLQGLIVDAFYDCSNLITLDLRHNSLIGTIPEWVGNLSSLGYLSLSYNNLEGEIPNQLCNLDNLKLLDLSHNNLSGPILRCLKFTEGSGVIYPGTDPQPLDFTTKWITYSYQQGILYYFSGMDLSNNNFGGEIPPEIGNLGKIKALNLSYNNLIGPIPSTFSNLSQIESLDLSYNDLEGKIPQLTQLYSLAVFSVAHNNLSGKTPERVAQFATFDESSYDGNPYLCGLPLPKSCTTKISPSPIPRVSANGKEESGFIDMGIFYVSFLVAYFLVLLTITAVLCINQNWRLAWFHLIEVGITNCRYFLEDNVYVLFKFKVS